MTTLVIGGGVAGLVAARRLALTGRRVVLLEAGTALGGRVAGASLAGVELDIGAESFAVRGGRVAALAAELGLGSRVVEPAAAGAWVALPDRTVPLPAAGVLGIPAFPLADDVRRVVDTGGSVRAYLDRVLPVLRVGRYDRLGPLVRGRMGSRVLDRLVAPVVESVYGASPDDVRVDAVAPQLNAAITRAGSLSGAVLALRAATPAGSAVQGIDGGVFRLVEALAAEVDRIGVEVRTGTRVLTLRPPPLQPGTWTAATDVESIEADEVVLAADGAGALDLLGAVAPALAALPRPAPTSTRAVLIAVDDPRLDAAPRGTGVLRAPSTAGIRATALTHVSAKWAWVADRLPPGLHVLRLSYRTAEAVPDAVVIADAAALLGIAIPPSVGRTDAVWQDTVPPLDERTAALRRAVDALGVPGLAVTGSWRTGTGLAQVVAGAEREADDLRT